MGGAARDEFEHIGYGRCGREEGWVARPEGNVVAEREGRQAEAESKTGGGVEEAWGRVTDIVKQVVGKGTEARGRADAAGGAQQHERKGWRAAEEAAGY